MSLVNYEKKGGVAIITLNRPERRNALNSEMSAELSHIWTEYSRDPEARVAILTGAGKAFCAGLDLSELGKPQTGTEADTRKSRFSDEGSTGGITRVEKPIIVAINGLALAAGCVIVLKTDIRIAAESAALGMPEVNVGLYSAADLLVAQGIPLTTVMELILTGKPMTAQRAYEVGLVNKVVPDNELMPAAMKVAETIAEVAPLAAKLNKKVALSAVKPSQELLDLIATVWDELTRL